MQHPVHPIPHKWRVFSILSLFSSRFVLLTVFAILVFVCGCEPPIPPSQSKPLDGQKLTLRCQDAAFADAITPIVKAWEVRSGATVTLAHEIMTPADDSDIGIIPTGGLGEWAEAGLLAPVPEELKRSDNSFQWFTLLPAYGERLVEWGGQTLAVPLTGDGFVIVYRTDRFADPTTKAEYAKRDPRGLVVPNTWQKFADIAVFFAERDKKPSLPPLPADAERFFDFFSRVAASADRRALGDLDVSVKSGRDRDALAFQFWLSTGKPRLEEAFGFKEAAAWLERLQSTKALPPAPGDDPIAALAEDKAVMAVLSLDQLSRLPRENGMVPPRFGVASIPGSNKYFNPDTKAVVPIVDNAGANYIPYYAGGRLGVVRSRCQNTKAAFELLAELGSPARSAEYVATPGLGAGPIRVTNFDRDRLILWLGYGFDEARSQALQDAMRQYVGQSVKNPAIGLRGPDRAALIPAAAGPLRQIGVGAKPLPPTEALKQIDDAWRALDKNTPEETLKRWRVRAAGLE